MASDDTTLSADLMSLLTSDSPMIMEEQVELKQAMMTDEEKAEALADLFGKWCTVNTCENKRVRKDLDKNAINFLMLQMRHEHEQTPMENKMALMEAQLICDPDEFSNACLEHVWS